MKRKYNYPLLDLELLKNSPIVAVIRLDNIGDHVLSSGFLKGLRLQLPCSHITMFVSECSKELYQHCNYIDRLIVWPLQATLGDEDLSTFDRFKKKNIFSYGQFDIVINPRFGEDFYQAYELAKELGAPMRIAFEQEKSDVNAFYTHLVTSPDNQHASEYANILLKALFGKQEHFVPEIWYGKNDEKQSHKKLLDAGWNGVDELLILSPSASAAHRVLPINTVTELIERLHDELHIRVVVVGGTEDLVKWDKLGELVSAKKYINAIGLFTLPEFAASCRWAKLFVGTDSGPKHIVAATGLPVVEIGYFPQTWPSLARGIWTSGKCWEACGVNSESILPAPVFSQSEVFNGQSISSISSSTILATVSKFWCAKKVSEDDLRLGNIDVNLKVFSNDELLPLNWRIESNQDVWCFNPSLIRIKQKWLFVYRVILTNGKRRLAVCYLDDKFNIIENSILGLSDFIQFAPGSFFSEHTRNWFADPRIFWLGDNLFLYFNSGWHEPFNHQFIVQLNPVTLRPISHARELRIIGDRQKIEKNWVLFGSDPYYVIYSANPHCILKANLNSLNEIWCERISSISLPITEYLLAGSMRGGAPPQYVNGQYYSFCHSLHHSPAGARYEACVYRFSSNPPFTPTHIPKHRLNLPNPQEKNRNLPQLNSAVGEVIYPCGAAFHEGIWFISYGINDESCAIASLTQKEVNNSMHRIIPDINSGFVY